jgi:hypothetical protein
VGSAGIALRNAFIVIPERSYRGYGLPLRKPDSRSAPLRE